MNSTIRGVGANSDAIKSWNRSRRCDISIRAAHSFLILRHGMYLCGLVAADNFDEVKGDL
jgi:hypothetical protein